MLVIQLAPFVIALIVMAWLIYSLFGDMIDQRVLLINASAGKLSRRFSSGVIRAAQVKRKPHDLSSPPRGGAAAAAAPAPTTTTPATSDTIQAPEGALPASANGPAPRSVEVAEAQRLWTLRAEASIGAQ